MTVLPEFQFSTTCGRGGSRAQLRCGQVAAGEGGALDAERRPAEGGALAAERRPGEVGPLGAERRVVDGGVSSALNLPPKSVCLPLNVAPAKVVCSALNAPGRWWRWFEAKPSDHIE